MGSLAFAAGGAAAGLGQGLADIGKSSLQEIREQAILRLQAEEADKRQQTELSAASARQQTGIEANTAQETRREAYETSAKSKEYDIMAKSAGAHADLLKALKQAEIEGRHRDVSDLIAGRVTVAEIRARQAAATAAGKTPGEFKAGKATLNSPGADALGNPIPGKPVDVQIHRDGSKWIQGPVGELYRFDPSAPTGYADPKGFGRPTAADTTALLQNPLGKMPSGILMRDYFVNKFGRLPSGYLGAAEGARAQMNASQSQPGAPKAPAASGTQSTADEVGDAQDDQQDNDYAMFGDRGHQPDDDQPAQE